MSDRIIHAAQLDLGGLFQGLCSIPPEVMRLPVSKLSVDSRDIGDGDVYVALAGSERHGLEFVAEVEAQGASAVLYEPSDLTVPVVQIPLIPLANLREMLPEVARRLSGAATDRLWTVGITGTDGKTSVSYFLAQALNATPYKTGVFKTGVMGTLGNGYPGDIEPGTHTTADVLALHRQMAVFRDDGAEAVVMEVSSHALDQARVAGLAFDVAVLTQLGRDHLDYHGTLKAYADAKRRLFYWPGLHWRVINADDSFGRGLLAKPCDEVSDVAYGLNPMLVRGSADHLLFATAIHPHNSGLEIAFDGTWGKGLIRTSLMGRFNAANLLAALAVLLIHGEPLKHALKRIETVQTAPGRMEGFGGGQRPRVVVDYAHTDGALRSAIEAVRAHTRGQLFTVFGCGGDRDRGKRPLMAEAAATLSDRVWVTDDNPRHEDPEAIIAELMTGVPEARRERVEIERNRAIAINNALNAAQAGDIVLVAGKGHEPEQLIGDERIPFSDIACVEDALGRRGDIT